MSKQKYYAEKFAFIDTFIKVVVVDDMNVALKKNALLNAWVVRQSKDDREEILNSMGFTAKIKPVIGRWKYYVVLTSVCTLQHIAHEATHLAFRILGNPPYKIEKKEEELVSQTVEVVFRDINILFQHAMLHWHEDYVPRIERKNETSKAG